MQDHVEANSFLHKDFTFVGKLILDDASQFTYSDDDSRSETHQVADKLSRESDDEMFPEECFDGISVPNLSTHTSGNFSSRRSSPKQQKFFRVMLINFDAKSSPLTLEKEGKDTKSCLC